MRKHFVLTFVGLIALLFIFASHERIAGVKSIKKGDIPSTGMVRPDLNFGKFPLYFISNKGQVDKKARFYAKASRYTLWLTKGGLVFDSFKPNRVEDRAKNEGKPHSKFNIQNSKLLTRDVSRLFFLNANKNPEMVPVDETQLRVNYFIGNDRSKWHGNIPTSQAVLYKNLYKNIDLKVYGIEKQIEYDWIVKPGGNPGDIRFQYKNVKGTQLDEDGNLLIETDFGELIHKKPVSFQEIRMEHGSRSMEGRIVIDVRFKKICKNTYGFEVGEYDKRCELIIDPVVLAYSTYLGGSEGDYGHAIAVDNSGYVYVTGYTYSPDFPTLNQYQTYQSCDTFIAKIDTTQSGTSSLIYSTYLGGDDYDEGYGIAVDGNGYAYITGYTDSPDFPTLNQYQKDINGYRDAFVTKIDTTQSGSSSLIYSTYLGGSNGGQGGSAIAVDSSGFTYVAGWTTSLDFPTLNQYQIYQDDSYESDAFMAKIDTTQYGTLSLVYSSCFGGDRSDGCTGIAVDSSGYTYIVGGTLSSDFPTLKPYQIKNQGGYDVFVTKIDPTQSGVSSLLYSTFLGGGSYEDSQGITVGNNGHVYITGYTLSSNFPTLNQCQADQGGEDAFIARLDTTKSGPSGLIYSTYLGGSECDVGNGIALDNDGYTYIVGNTSSSDFPTLNQYQIYQGGAEDVFVTKIDTTKNGASSIIYSTYLGGGNWEKGGGIAVDNEGYAYVTGWTESTDFPILNQYQTAQPGYDVFVTKLFYPVPPTVTTTPVFSITTTSAESGGEVTYDGGEEVTARGVCWSTSPDPTSNDNHTTDGTGTGTFDSSLTDLTPNTVYYVRAYATNAMGTAYGHEEIFETDEPSITVTSPNGGETWEVNSPQTITWTSQYVEGNVKIEYSTNGGGLWTEIIASTPNDGSHPWTVPNVPSDQCLIRISETNGSTSDISNGFFTIFQPAITVISPNGGEIWEVGAQKNITWTSTGTVGNVKIEYSTDNGGQWMVIIASTYNDGSFPWIVPGTVSNQCLVQVSETDGSPSDKSDKVFSIVASPSITVISPNGGETLYDGFPETITWASSGNVGNVKIQYSTNGGGNWNDIIGSTENDGSFPWTVPNDVSSECLVRVADTGGSPSDTSNNVFSIVQTPIITVTSPNGGENWDVGSAQTITWTSEGNVGNVLIQYSVNGGSKWRPVVRSTENDGSFNWTVPNRPSDNCLVRISADDPDGGPSDTSDDLFSIVPLPIGAITVTSPNGGEQLVPGSPHEIKWTAEGTNQVPYVTIEYSIDRGVTWATVVSSLNNAADGSFDWTVPNTPSDNCLLRIRGINGDGDPSDSSDGVFSIIPLSSPAFTVTSPNGGESWLVNSQQEITWETSGIVDNVKIDYSTNDGESWTEIVGSTPNNGTFDWDVPNTPSDNCLVRVGDADNGGLPSDTGDAVFSIVPVPSIIVTSPNGGEQWEAGSSQTVTWTSTGTVGDVKIEYSTDGGDSWIEITSNEFNDGSYNWTVPDTPSVDCLVRITGNDSDPADPLLDASDNEFSIIEAQEPSLVVSSPNGGEDLFVGLSHEITWTSFGSVGNVAIDYSPDGGDNWTEIIQSTENDGSYEWFVPDAVSGNCLVRVSETDGDPLDISDAVFSIIALPEGTITLTSPNGGETWLVDSTREITWTGTGEINDVTIHYSLNSGTTWTTIAASTPNDGSFDWTVPGTPSDNCLVRVRAKIGDWDGGPSDTSDQVFSIFSPLSAVLRVVYPNGEEVLDAGSEYNITWASNGIDNVFIEYSTNNGVSWGFIAAAAASDGIYLWTVPETGSDNCLVRISGNDGGENPSDVSDAVFTIQSQQASVEVMTPNGGESIGVGAEYNITWTYIGLQNVLIEYSDDNGDTWYVIDSFPAVGRRYTWTVPDTPSANCLVRVSGSGVSDVSDAVFSIAADRP